MDFLREKISRGFDLLDADGDGSLDPAEFESAVVEYWSSTDPAAPGNWWMGRPDARG
ncbi:MULTISPECIES: hypothetical protein [Streptomyces]|uniref:hypothetical protein n=1 Tax=Streptomyces TaxID=1883 RepID=UPI00163CBF6B|nr:MULTISPECIES: hypothetical protein [Streptomyces]